MLNHWLVLRLEIAEIVKVFQLMCEYNGTEGGNYGPLKKIHSQIG